MTTPTNSPQWAIDCKDCREAAQQLWTTLYERFGFGYVKAMSLEELFARSFHARHAPQSPGQPSESIRERAERAARKLFGDAPMHYVSTDDSEPIRNVQPEVVTSAASTIAAEFADLPDPEAARKLIRAANRVGVIYESAKVVPGSVIQQELGFAMKELESALAKLEKVKP